MKYIYQLLIKCLWVVTEFPIENLRKELKCLHQIHKIKQSRSTEADLMAL